MRISLHFPGLPSLVYASRAVVRLCRQGSLARLAFPATAPEGPSQFQLGLHSRIWCRHGLAGLRGFIGSRGLPRRNTFLAPLFAALLTAAMSQPLPFEVETGKNVSVYSVTEKSEAWTTTTHLEAQPELREAQKTDGEEYPDGVWRAWMTVLGAFCALVCTFGQLSSFGTFQSWYQEHQLHELAPSTISWIGALQLWVFFFSVSVSILYCLRDVNTFF